MKVFWWRHPKGILNLGDEITFFILHELFDESAVWAGYNQADLISTGSILRWCFGYRKQKKIGVVGSGFMSPIADIKELSFPEHVQVYSCRGYLTKAILGELGVNVESVGDPGLLFRRLVKSTSEKKYKIGFIPHISKFRKYEDLLQSSDVKIIDMRTDDYKKVADDILSCELIVSQGLHGLIFSDSLGVPNVWADFGSLHQGGEFKFYDYFSSVGRDFDKKIIDEKALVSHGVEDYQFSLRSDVREKVENKILSAYGEFLKNHNAVD